MRQRRCRRHNRSSWRRWCLRQGGWWRHSEDVHCWSLIQAASRCRAVGQWGRSGRQRCLARGQRWRCAVRRWRSRVLGWEWGRQGRRQRRWWRDFDADKGVIGLRPRRHRWWRLWGRRVVLRRRRAVASGWLVPGAAVGAIWAVLHGRHDALHRCHHVASSTPRCPWTAPAAWPAACFLDVFLIAGAGAGVG